MKVYSSNSLEVLTCERVFEIITSVKQRYELAYTNALYVFIKIPHLDVSIQNLKIKFKYLLDGSILKFCETTLLRIHELQEYDLHYMILRILIFYENSL